VEEEAPGEEGEMARQPILTAIPGDWPRVNWALIESFTDLCAEEEYVRIKWKHYEHNEVGDPVGKSALEPLAEAVAAIRAIRDWTLVERLQYLDDSPNSETSEMQRERIQWISADGSARLGYFNLPEQSDWVAFELAKLKYAFVAVGPNPLVNTSNFSYMSYSDICYATPGTFEAITPIKVIEVAQAKIDSMDADDAGGSD